MDVVWPSVLFVSLGIRVPLMWTQDDHNKTKTGMFLTQSSNITKMCITIICLNIIIVIIAIDAERSAQNVMSVTHITSHPAKSEAAP